MVSISLRIPEALAAELAAARRRGASQSALIREAIEAFLNTEGAHRPTSALGLVADLAGSCEGPDVLSRNPKYLEGFGQ